LNPYQIGLTDARIVPVVQIGVSFDSAGIGHEFGDVLVDVPSSSTFKAGQTVSAQFVGANPRVRFAASSSRTVTYIIDLLANIDLTEEQL
jgi:hypothetical protein